MGELTLENLLSTGISLEELLINNNEPPVVNITVDTKELAKYIDNSIKSNADSLSSIKDVIAASNKSNKDLLVKALSALIQKDRIDNKTKGAKLVTGIKVIRNKLNLIDELRLIRD
jgi:hypothetical protein